MEKLLQNYNDACNSIIQAFCEKQGFDYQDAWWVADIVGSVISIGDFTFDFQDVIYDLKNNVPKGRIIAYFDYTMETHFAGKKLVNYKTFCEMNEIRNRDKKL